MTPPLNCPICRARNDEGPQCRRCRADLSLLFDLETQRSRLLSEGCRQVARGQWANAGLAADRALQLRGDDDALRLRAVAALMQRDFATAWNCFARTKQRSE